MVALVYQFLRPVQPFRLIFTHIFLTSVVLVLNKVVLVLVIDSLGAIEHEQKPRIAAKQAFSSLARQEPRPP